MSAYSVPDEQLHVMVSYILKTIKYGGKEFYCPPSGPYHVGNIYEPHRENLQRIWNILRVQNDRSVSTRYAHDQEIVDNMVDGEMTPFIIVKTLPEPIEMIKYVENYMYQACETDDWYTSHACNICYGIMSAAHEQTPGWQEADWGFRQRIEPDTEVMSYVLGN